MLADVLIVSAVVIAGLMLVQWLLSIPLRNVSIVDIGWGLGFVAIAWVGVWRCDITLKIVQWPRWLLPVFVTIWGLRLALHLTKRNIGKPEDYRYAAMREARGPAFVWSSLGIVFGLQGAVMWVVSLPVQMALARPTPSVCHVLSGIGVAVWTIGLAFEALGDWQLAQFKADPAHKGRVMDRGLWKWTRHPNYFGDFLIWWGHWLLSLGVSDYGSTWWSIISPLLMSFLLIRVSGVALLEKALRARSPEYAAYIERTSAFIPWWPKEAPHERDRSH